ncbi:L-fucose mutarotase [Rhodobium orientis]|uniref:Fucose isomerase n=1 Tax=Rhodobium orientis TaxID=34017 RepID=A0A327JN79_9HYPH|nr:L-fucose mutarotase [Rhodobium orientis]MBB4304561.1 L-fucose mutarotase [Rhodobium orientis]MBK5951404.1 fucose isomerase [Rhodobium orientis]RAI27521.1 fucose isomerase [Rhodobium orientis]
MLRGISPLIPPDLLHVLAQMGHGDEIVFSDALFPAHSIGQRVIRLDGVEIPRLLEAVLPLFPIDTYVEDSIVMVAPPQDDVEDPELESKYRSVIDKYDSGLPETTFLQDRHDFYARARLAFCVVVTGSVVKYGNLLLKKGVY